MHRLFPIAKRRGWFILFLTLSAIIMYVTVEQHQTHWNMTLRRVQSVDFNMLHASLPYAFAFLEQHKRRDLIQNVIDSNFGLFGVVYLDADGRVIFKSSNLRPNVRFSRRTLATSWYSTVYQYPYPQQVGVDTIYSNELSQRSPRPPFSQGGIGNIYLIRSSPPSFLQTLVRKENWRRLFANQASDYFKNIIFNLSLIVALLVICVFGSRLQRRVEVAESAAHEAELEALSRSVAIAELHLQQTQDDAAALATERDLLTERIVQAVCWRDGMPFPSVNSRIIRAKSSRSI